MNLPRIALIGPNGSGKTTVAKRVAEQYHLTYLSAGDTLRNASSLPWVQDIIGAYNVHSGELLDDALLTKLATRMVEEAPSHVGWVFDGVPRRTGQAMAMMRDFPPNVLIILEASKEAVMTRLSQRGRADDAEDIIALRYDIYQKETQPMIDALFEYNYSHGSRMGIIRVRTDGHSPDVVYERIRLFLPFV